MQLQHIPIEQALGAVLVHNVAGADGFKALAKGKVVRAEDIDTLRALGQTTVYVAITEPGDVREDQAAARLAPLVAGERIAAGPAIGGRVNLSAAGRGLLRINRNALGRLNELPGITLATLRDLTPVAPKKIVATIKTIGLAVSEVALDQAERIARADGPVLACAPIRLERVAILLTGSANGRPRVQETYAPPIRARVEELGAVVMAEEYVAEDEAEIGAAIQAFARAGAQVIILAGETSIMDMADITPRGIQRAGGRIEVFGAPVEPGNLLLLAYCGAVPVIGAPGCVKSRETNVVDLILPRLLAGEPVTAGDVNAFAEGGLLVGRH